jgi:hypothetical protein
MKTLETLACECLEQNSDSNDAWIVFRDEANAMYSPDDDGDHANYAAKYREIFEAEKMSQFDQAIELADPTEFEVAMMAQTAVFEKIEGELYRLALSCLESQPAEQNAWNEFLAEARVLYKEEPGFYNQHPDRFDDLLYTAFEEAQNEHSGLNDQLCRKVAAKLTPDVRAVLDESPVLKARVMAARDTLPTATIIPFRR